MTILPATEIVNGKPFDVHTVRIVQLYPLQAGLFTIDAMEVTNKVEFSKSVVNKKPNRRLLKVFLKTMIPLRNNNTVTYENSISTEKIDHQCKTISRSKKTSGI